jgi:biotin carboxyl carrier protein
MKYVATVDGQDYRISLVGAEGLAGVPIPSAVETLGEVLVTVDGVPLAVDLQTIDGGFHYSLLVGAGSYEVFVERCEDVCFVTLEGQRYQVRVKDARPRRPREKAEATLEEAGEVEVTSPMPGVVVAVLVEEERAVRTGEGLVILEAMKMENEIRSPRNGVVYQVSVTPGQSVGQGAPLVRIGRPGR